MTTRLFEKRLTEKTAVITETGAEISSSALFDDIEQTARLFKARAVVFIVCRNDYMSLLFYLAALEADAVPLLLNADNPTSHLTRLVELYTPHYIVSPEADIPGFTTMSSVGDYMLYKNPAPDVPALHPDLAFLATTSGSTGDPKLVRLSANNLKSNAAAIADYLDITPEDRAITSLPISYSYGLSVINSHLHAGASIVLSDHSLMQKEFWQQINEHNVTSFAGVPYHYEMLLRLRLERLNIPTITKMTQAGGRLDPDKLEKVATFCNSKGIRFWTMYGQTEAAPRISYVPSDRTLDKLGSIGIPVPGGKLWIRGENGNDITASGNIGELVYEGPNVCLGYAESKEDLALGDVNQGVLATGDLAHCDEDGYFYLEGRLRRFIKVYGNRISLDQVEGYLGESGLESAAHGHDDALIVHVVVREGLGEEEIKRDLATYTGVNATAIRVVSVEQLPRLATGKIDYQCLIRTN